MTGTTQTYDREKRATTHGQHAWFLNALPPQSLPDAAVLHYVECLTSTAATQSGWCHSVALCPRCWGVNKWSVVEQSGLMPASSADWLASSAGMKSWLKSLYKMGIEQVGWEFDGDDGSPPLCITLIVVSHQIGVCSWGLRASLYCRRKCYVESSGGVFDHLCVDSSRVCSLASFELSSCIVNDFIVLVLLFFVLVFVFVRHRWRVKLLAELCEHVRNVLWTFLSLVFMDDVFFESAEGAQDVRDVVSSFFVFDRACFVVDHLACVMFCLSVFMWGCVAFSYGSVW